MHRESGVGGDVDAHQLTVAQLVGLLILAVDEALHERANVTRGTVDARRYQHIAHLAGVDGLGFCDRRAAPPPLDHPRVPGLGHRTLAEIGSDEYGVRILPADIGFPFGQVEPVWRRILLSVMSNSRTTDASEPPRDRLTSARVYSGSMTSAPFQTQFSPSASASASTSMMTSQSGESVLYDSSVVRRHSPRGLAASTQDVVQELITAPDVGNPCIGVQDAKCLGPHPLEPVATELVEGQLIVRPYPLRHLVIADGLEPEVGVGPDIGHYSYLFRLLVSTASPISGGCTCVSGYSRRFRRA